MREIKLRQAIYLNGKFYHWHYWGFIDNAFIGIDTGLCSPKTAIENSQQYTGLKDKNGKDYYFDDIAKWNNKLWVVVWSRTLASIELQPITNYAARQKDAKVKRLYGTSFGIGQAHSSEKVGDIYSNPELREEKK